MRLTTLCLGYFKRYVEREIAKSTNVIVKKPLQGWRMKRIRPAYHFNEHRPWTDAAKQANSSVNKYPRIYLEPIKDWKIFLGDRSEYSLLNTYVKITVKEYRKSLREPICLCSLALAGDRRLVESPDY